MKKFNELANIFKKRIIDLSHSGPIDSDYDFLNEYFEKVSLMRSHNYLSQEEFLETRNWFNGSMTTLNTLQGHVCLKPRGYDGDFEIIDKIYKEYITSSIINKNWDVYFQSGSGPKAVRNRKEYFISILLNLADGSEILNLASGPCRDLAEFSEKSYKQLTIDNVDLDEKSVEYAKSILGNSFNLQLSFFCANILKFRPTKKYDLIWSAGLFDYLNDSTFILAVKKYSKYIKPGGRMIIGNFSLNNPSRAYMEYGNWFLHHRDDEKLLSLLECIPSITKSIVKEALGINSFIILQF